MMTCREIPSYGLILRNPSVSLIVSLVASLIFIPSPSVVTMSLLTTYLPFLSIRIFT